MDKPYLRELSKPSFENPILVQGLPGFGNVGRIAAHLLTKFAGAKTFAELYSPSFPDYVSIGAMLYGMSLLYGFAGTSTLTSRRRARPSRRSRGLRAAAGQPAFLVAIVLVFAGLAYKVAAAPFQFWCPDVYEGAPTSVAAFLAVASKGAGFAAILRFVGAVTAGTTPDVAASSETVRTILLAMALLTMTVGNVAALRQCNAKRLLAYSAIAHAGYLLLGVAVTTAAGATAVVFYMAVYLFMTLGAFYMVGVVYCGR